MAQNPSVDDFDALPVEEQVAHVQILWERIARHESSVASPDWHLELVRARLGAHQDGSDESIEWSTLRDELLSKS